MNAGDHGTSCAFTILMALHTDPHRALRYRWCRGETATHWYVGFSNKFPPFLHNWCQTPIPILSDVWAAARGYPHNVPCVSVCVCVWILYVTYLTSAVAMLVKEVHIKQTCADRRTSKYSHKWTPIAILKDTQHYWVGHGRKPATFIRRTGAFVSNVI